MTPLVRRQSLMQELQHGLILFPGNQESPMNYADNTYPFRQDSHFLYFSGIDRPDLYLLLDADQGATTLFGDDFTLDQIVWLGQLPDLQSLANHSGIESVKPSGTLREIIEKAVQTGRKIHILPPYRAETKEWLRLLFAAVNRNFSKYISEDLIRQVVRLRSNKDVGEIAEMEQAVNLSGAMHQAAMKAARPGMREYELTGLVEGIAVSGGGRIAYPVILTTQGQTLHNHHYGRSLKEGDLVLGDFGAEAASHYAGDITRTFPVSRSFSTRQKEIYEIVLHAEQETIKRIRPGVLYRDLHQQAALDLTSGLITLGLMQGNPLEAVSAGAHTLFFPHGLGHMIGLDVHDMEDVGEDFVGYDGTISRNPDFGWKSLRLARRLEVGFTLTVEPGIYFIPQLIDRWELSKKGLDFIRYDRLKSYRDFTGVRIEDNVLVTESGSRVLGNPIPKSVAEVESLRQY